MDPDTLSNLIELAEEREQRKKHYLAWVAQLPYMDEDTYISFEEYFDRVTLRNVDMRPVSEIEAEIEEIEKKLGD